MMNLKQELALATTLSEPMLDKVVQLAKDYALSCVPEEKSLITRDWGSTAQKEGWNHCVKTIRENIRKDKQDEIS